MSSCREDEATLLRSAQREGKMPQTQVSPREIPIEYKEKLLHGKRDKRPDQLAQRSCGICVLGDI